MLSTKEKQIATKMNIGLTPFEEINEVLRFEKKYNKNSLEIINQKENLTSDFIKWKLLIEKIVYLNENFYKINKMKDITFLTYNKKLGKNKFTEYLNLISEYVKHNPNTIFILSNHSNLYKKIIGGLNQRGIMVLLLTDNKEDIYLEYTNLIVQYTENIGNSFKVFQPKQLEFDLGEAI